MQILEFETAMLIWASKMAMLVAENLSIHTPLWGSTSPILQQLKGSSLNKTLSCVCGYSVGIRRAPHVTAMG